MTKDEFSQKITESIWEELADMEKYKALADSAPEKYAPILRDIAKEESAHRKHLEDILADLPIAKNAKDKIEINETEQGNKNGN